MNIPIALQSSEILISNRLFTLIPTGASVGAVGLALPAMLGPGNDTDDCYQYLPSTTNNDLIQ